MNKYYEKYLKYKNKYLALKYNFDNNLLGGITAVARTTNTQNRDLPPYVPAYPRILYNETIQDLQEAVDIDIQIIPVINAIDSLISFPLPIAVPGGYPPNPVLNILITNICTEIGNMNIQGMPKIVYHLVQNKIIKRLNIIEWDLINNAIYARLLDYNDPNSINRLKNRSGNLIRQLNYTNAQINARFAITGFVTVNNALAAAAAGAAAAPAIPIPRQISALDINVQEVGIPIVPINLPNPVVLVAVPVPGLVPVILAAYTPNLFLETNQDKTFIFESNPLTLPYLDNLDIPSLDRNNFLIYIFRIYSNLINNNISNGHISLTYRYITKVIREKYQKFLETNINIRQQNIPNPLVVAKEIKYRFFIQALQYYYLNGRDVYTIDEICFYLSQINNPALGGALVVNSKYFDDYILQVKYETPIYISWFDNYTKPNNLNQSFAFRGTAFWVNVFKYFIVRTPIDQLFINFGVGNTANNKYFVNTTNFKLFQLTYLIINNFRNCAFNFRNIQNQACGVLETRLITSTNLNQPTVLAPVDMAPFEKVNIPESKVIDIDQIFTFTNQPILVNNDRFNVELKINLDDDINNEITYTERIEDLTTINAIVAAAQQHHNCNHFLANEPAPGPQCHNCNNLRQLVRDHIDRNDSWKFTIHGDINIKRGGCDNNGVTQIKNAGKWSHFRRLPVPEIPNPQNNLCIERVNNYIIDINERSNHQEEEIHYVRINGNYNFNITQSQKRIKPPKPPRAPRDPNYYRRAGNFNRYDNFMRIIRNEINMTHSLLLHLTTLTT